MAQTVNRHRGKQTFSRMEVLSTGGIEGPNLVQTTSIEASAVTAAKIATSAVETAKIKTANVTAAKLATSAVETAKIKALNVTTAKIAAAAVTVAKAGDEIAATSLAGAGGMPYILRRTAAHGSGTVNSFVKSDHKGKIIDIWVRKVEGGSASTGAATVTVKTSTGGSISDAMDITVKAGTIVRAGSLSTGLSALAADAILTVEKAGVGTGSSVSKSHAYEVFIQALKSS